MLRHFYTIQNDSVSNSFWHKHEQYREMLLLNYQKALCTGTFFFLTFTSQRALFQIQIQTYCCLYSSRPSSQPLLSFDCCKVLLLPHPPCPQFWRPPFIRFQPLFSRETGANYIIPLSVYSSLNFETKVCRSSGTMENPAFQFGKMAGQLFAFFYSCKFLLLALRLWNLWCSSGMLLYSHKKHLYFLTIVNNVFSLLFVVSFRTL